MFICMHKITKSTWSNPFYLGFCKDITNFLVMPTKINSITWRLVWCLSACTKSTSSIPYFLRYCKDITNLLFWVLWVHLAMTSKTDTTILAITFWDIFMFDKMFMSPHVKRIVIIRNEHGICELPHKLPNDLRLRLGP